MKNKNDQSKITQEEIEKYYLSIVNMIWSIIHQFNNISFQDKEDIFQETSVFITTKLIYKYDKSKNVAFKDFVYVCIKNFVLRKINNLNKRNKTVVVNSEILDTLPEEIDESSDFNYIDKVEQIRKLLKEDSSILRDREKTVLQMIVDNPKITQREMSDKMGFSFASGVGAILRRFRKRVNEQKILEDV